MSKKFSVHEFLDGILTTKKLEEPAELAHQGWLTAKEEGLKDPNNPFQGYGPSRIKVGDLSVKEKADLGILLDANPSDDVYHPLYLPFEELDSETQGKNLVPLLVLCYGIGDFLLGNAATKDDLVNLLQGIISGKDFESVDMLMRLNHVSFQAGEVRVGSRPYGPNAREDFPLYSSLHPEVQKLDEYTLLPAVNWLLNEIKNGDN
ncbi:MAG: hypothetical protein CL685_00485 [Candidatus Magasanikbacteria bacterium]|nr:hypothetical protein [Candidatus Magasanikbacteria bacterium]|tara:strand:- start:490 stop:1104 length:615 start_codon:yes stop_codon:yes gene_type:complete